MWINVALALAVFTAGWGLALQGIVNAGLAKGLGSSVMAATVSFLTGSVALVVVSLASGGVGQAMSSARSLGVGWWIGGGLLGAMFVTMVTFAVPRIGVAAVAALLVAGQLIAAALFDHFGVLGAPVHPLNAARIAGVGLLIGGATLVRLF